MAVRQQSKRELAAALQGRYLKAGKAEKGRLLDEFVAVTGYHRRYALTLLRHGEFGAKAGGKRAGVRAKERRGRRRAYSAVVVGALRVAAEAAGWPCGKRLAPFLGEWLPELEAAGLVGLGPAERGQLVGMSAATIDRRLAIFRPAAHPHGLGTTKPGTLLKAQVPIRTYTPWEDQKPGFLEIDLVAHCGTSTAGFYVNTLTMTDVATGWTECVGVWGKGQAAVFEGLKAVRARLPFPLLGIDSDNGSEFLNALLLRYCEAEAITFTRGRPYWKNDQAHVEQKNWSVVRRLIGYDRYESRAALDRLNRAYRLLRLWTNHWQPTLKLVAKERDGAKVRKRYDTARTPYRRLLAAGVLSPEAAADLRAEHAARGAIAIREELETEVEQLWRLKRPDGLAI